jgi:hypothetical protein
MGVEMAELKVRHRADRFVRALYFRVLRPAARPVVSEMLSRLSFGVLTISAMAWVAAAILLPVAFVGAIVDLAGGEWLHALVFFVVTLALCAVSAAFAFAVGFAGLPFSSDWITEWPAYALGFGFGLAGCALLAVLIFLTPLPAYGAVPLTLVAVGGAGYTVAYLLPVSRPRLARVRRPKR